ncbi:hypothetical protein CLV35_0971 [Motilibacter peucedani]|uniref:DUF4386 family protein n=1 Tax=Motilibacter peucedani TaxID=598650 RepID=A0A420XUM7_9ACTN|nr:hypothetical protein [Motilibacter peucedani]RKS80534.1 hypothetical protein CLV35_0971 [Motilibacter peucedani]
MSSSTYAESLASGSTSRLVPTPAASPEERPLDRPRRALWAWSGIAAGVAGAAATFLGPQTSSEDVTSGGAEAVWRSLHDQTTVRIGASVGFLATALLLVFAVGFSRWLEEHLPSRSLVPAAVRMGLTGSVGALVVSYGFKAMLAGGMPGGIDHAMYTHSDVSALLIITGQIQWLGWMGVAFALAATAAAVLRGRVLPLWIGILAALNSLAVAVMTLAFALPYSAGVLSPIVLALLGVTLVASRKAQR